MAFAFALFHTVAQNRNTFTHNYSLVFHNNRKKAKNYIINIFDWTIKINMCIHTKKHTKTIPKQFPNETRTLFARYKRQSD